MNLKKKFVNVFAIACCCKMLLSATPAYAFIPWPSISLPAVAAFVNTVTTGVAQVGVSKAQIENYTKTIHAIGDQVSTIAKYVAELDKTIENIIQSVEEIIQALKYTLKAMDDILAAAEEMMEEAEEENVETAETTVDTVNDQANKGDTVDPEIIDDVIDDNKEQNERVNKNFDDATKKIKEAVASGKETLQSLLGTVNKGNLSEEDKANLIKEIEDMQKRLEDLEKNALDLIETMKNNYDSNSDEMVKAYSDYQQAIIDFNDGKITREELNKKGEELKELAKNAQDSTNYTNQLSEFSQQITDLFSEIDNLSETINNTLANNKDYPDDAMLNIIDSSQKYAFNFHQKTNHIQLKGCYATKGNKGCKLFNLKAGDKSFLLSKELTAKGKVTVQDSKGRCQNLTFDDLEEGHQDWFVAKLRDCITRANTEKTYFWPEIGDEEELAKMNIFDGVTEPIFHKDDTDSYEKKGVYRHITEDYASANILNSNQTKHYARTWLGRKKDDKKSTLNGLLRQFADIDNTRDAFSFISLVEIEYLKMYSRLRRVDAINRAKEAVDIFRPLEHLYIDGRDEDYRNANEANPPTGSVKDKVCTKWGDCDNKYVTVISNVFPSICGLQGSEAGGKAFSVLYDSKNDAGAMEGAENAIKECMKMYVERATNGSEGGSPANDPDFLKREWHIKEIKAMTDSLYDTFAIATMNLYRSAKDYAYLKKLKDVNVATLNQDVKDSKSSLNDYGAGAKINHYGAQQLLTIIDADAQALQSEILEDMLNVSLDFFQTENPNRVAVE